MLNKLRTIPLYVRILAGMIAGVFFGIVAIQGSFGGFVSNWISPFGDIFMRMLKLVAVPLIFVSLIKGVGNLRDISSLSSLGIKTLMIYIGTTVAAISIGILFGTIISPGRLITPDSAENIKSVYSVSVEESSEVAVEIEASGPLQPIVDMVPDNIFAAFSNNANMLQVIFVAILIGVAVLLVGSERSGPFMVVVESFDAVIVKVIDVVMAAAPYGVFALMAGMIVDCAGDLGLLSALGLYAVTVAAALFTLIFVFYPSLIRLFTNIPVRKFLKTMSPVQLLAFTTSSSAATLPLNMETVEKGLGVSQRTTSFVLPVGVTINMDGTSCYQAIAVLLGLLLKYSLKFYFFEQKAT